MSWGECGAENSVLVGWVVSCLLASVNTTHTHTHTYTLRSMLLAMFVMVFGAFVCVAGTTSILLDLGGS